MTPGEDMVCTVVQSRRFSMAMSYDSRASTKWATLLRLIASLVVMLRDGEIFRKSGHGAGAGIGVGHDQIRHLFLQRQHVEVAAGEDQRHGDGGKRHPPRAALAAPGDVGDGQFEIDRSGDGFVDFPAGWLSTGISRTTRLARSWRLADFRVHLMPAGWAKPVQEPDRCPHGQQPLIEVAGRTRIFRSVADDVYALHGVDAWSVAVQQSRGLVCGCPIPACTA